VTFSMATFPYWEGFRLAQLASTQQRSRDSRRIIKQLAFRDAGAGPTCTILGRLEAAGHDDFTGADGFHDVEFAEQADGGVELIGVTSDEGDEAVFLEIDGLAVVMLDDLQDLGALHVACGDFDQDEFFGDGVAVSVFGAVDDVDKLIHLHDDLVQAFWMTADADGHAAESWITCLGDDEGLDVEATTAEHGADTTENAGLVVHHHAERVDVDDVSLWSWLNVSGGWDAVAHGMDDG
jgi:hypothetical protein